MMKSYFYIILFTLLPCFAIAQSSFSEQIEAKKVAFLTTKLDLSVDESKVFWPIYNEYTREINKLKSERTKNLISFRKINEIEDLSDEEIQDLIQNDFNYRQKNLNIERKYYNKLKSNLPLKVIGKYYRAQEAFKKELLRSYRPGRK